MGSRFSAGAILVFSSFLLTLLGVVFGFVGETDRRDDLEGEVCRVERVDAEGPFGVAIFSGDIERRIAPLVVTISCCMQQETEGLLQRGTGQQCDGSTNYCKAGSMSGLNEGCSIRRKR